ncbi:hypothetical protein AVEN_92867-1 [Araneus ventricosus]|uniref:Uncharacterized protein n=1 Tax=Araneus ventricosus TaxID=182803 RepID=A0A4Y2S5D7_ARAVE|nr:hypothetical protein AVEN_92867-1 [Araneus ventricosus]
MVISAAPLLTLFRGRGECLMFARQDTGDASAVSSNESGRGKTLKAYRTQLRGNGSIGALCWELEKWRDLFLDKPMESLGANPNEFAHCFNGHVGGS